MRDKAETTSEDLSPLDQPQHPRVPVPSILTLLASRYSFFQTNSGYCFFALLGNITKICFVPSTILAPILLVMSAFGGYTAEDSYLGILMTFVFGGLGFAPES